MELYVKNAIEKYQCMACERGFSISCYAKGVGVECSKHSPSGSKFYGLPDGLNAVGDCPNAGLNIFTSYKQYIEDRFKNRLPVSVPAVKHFDGSCFTIVGGFYPFTNRTFLYIILEDCYDAFYCIDLSEVY